MKHHAPQFDLPLDDFALVGERRGITKRQALDAVSELGAIQAVEHLAGALANAQDRDVEGIRSAMLSIESELDQWSKTKQHDLFTD